MKRSQTNILPHSEAKLELYSKYLERYLPVLSFSNYISKINIFDVFCGTGIYVNGKKGSPLIAFEKIQENQNKLKDIGKPLKLINLTINDGELKHVQNVANYLNNLNTNHSNITINYFNEKAEDLFEKILNQIHQQDPKERNLIFVDPYGYKDINKNIIENMLSNNRTELLIFLPISFIMRFKNIALESEKNCYSYLQKFIKDFFPGGHPVYSSNHINTFEFIETIEKAFSFNGKYFSLSHSIERSTNNHFAVFFISPHILGFEKMLAVKWEADQDFGKGYRINNSEGTLFEELDKEENKRNNYQFLESKLIEFFATTVEVTNIKLYEFTLKNRYLPKHTNEILINWKNAGHITIKDANNNCEINGKSFYITYKEYKNNTPKIKIRMKSNGSDKY